MENKSIATNTIEHLLELLAQHGGTIESTGSLHVEEINNARASGRMYVDEHSLGYVWIPKLKGAFPTTVEEVELFEKYYPLPVEMPERLKRPDWLFKKPNRITEPHNGASQQQPDSSNTDGQQNPSQLKEATNDPFSEIF